MHLVPGFAAMLIALSFCCSQARAETPLGILLAAGDVASCNSEKDEAVAAVIERHVREADDKKIPVHVLTLGDLAYERGTKENFECFDRSWGRLLKLPLKNSDVKRLMLPVPGNHEYTQPGGQP